MTWSAVIGGGVVGCLDKGTIRLVDHDQISELDNALLDALKLVAEGINAMRGPERAMLMITHYQRLLDYVVPDMVHVLFEGQIVKSGPKELALELEKEGYGQFFETAA